MSVGKFSPTLCRCTEEDFTREFPSFGYDSLGYDMYGYHRSTKKDRAGYSEEDYILDDSDLFERIQEHYILKPNIYDTNNQ